MAGWLHGVQRWRDRLGGAQDIDALIAYFAAFKQPNPPYDPNAAALGKPRLIRVDSGNRLSLIFPHRRFCLTKWAFLDSFPS